MSVVICTKILELLNAINPIKINNIIKYKINPILNPINAIAAAAAGPTTPHNCLSV